MLRQVAAEEDKLRPRIRHVNARFYYVTIFNCSLNDASNPFWNIALVTPDFLSFIIVARQTDLNCRLFLSYRGLRGKSTF